MEELGWVVELEDDKNPGCVSGRYFGAIPIPGTARLQHGWTQDVYAAFRFARKIDGENIAKCFAPLSSVIVNEHSWG